MAKEPSKEIELHPDGMQRWTKLALTDLPNDLISEDDLKGVLIDIVDVAAV
jgi:hypothetical protein